jgi:hypothetical protein
VNAQTAFPTDGLEPRIDFWKQVFTQYGADDIVVHDRFHVNLIYAVADDDTVEQTVRNVKDGLRQIRDRLTAAGLSVLDRFIISLLVGPIKRDLGISDVQFGVLNGFAFTVTYAVFGVA